MSGRKADSLDREGPGLSRDDSISPRITRINTNEDGGHDPRTCAVNASPNRERKPTQNNVRIGLFIRVIRVIRGLLSYDGTCSLISESAIALRSDSLAPSDGERDRERGAFSVHNHG